MIILYHHVHDDNDNNNDDNDITSMITIMKMTTTMITMMVTIVWSELRLMTHGLGPKGRTTFAKSIINYIITLSYDFIFYTFFLISQGNFVYGFQTIIFNARNSPTLILSYQLHFFLLSSDFIGPTRLCVRMYYSDVTWTRKRLNSLFLVECIGHRWILLTKAWWCGVFSCRYIIMKPHVLPHG